MGSASALSEAMSEALLPEVAGTDPSELEADGEPSDPAPRPFCVVLRQCTVIAAIASGATAMYVMLLIMTATPLAMSGKNGFGFSLEDTTTTIQVHIVAMFVPGLVTGDIITKIGAAWTIVLGLLCFCLSIGTGLINYPAAPPLYAMVTCLLLLGVGWNWTYIGGTRLLITGYRESEAKNIQGFNESFCQAGATVGALLAGVLLQYSWATVLFAAAPPIVVTAVVILVSVLSQKCGPDASD